MIWSWRRISLKGWIGRSSRLFSSSTARSMRRRRNQRTEGNRKCDRKATAANSTMSTSSQRGTSTRWNIPDL